MFTGGAPVCKETFSYVEVPEDTEVGTLVKKIACDRQYKDSTGLNYAIQSGNTHGKFWVNSTNDVGFVYVFQSISYESRTDQFHVSFV